ncbi:MAG: glycosyltransferase [Porphyrobacter sp.]|jgi:glycosyltransferase involved in cell wall biosynthesis|nr:glycosyltransferase [Porphyrobacter sp.]
MKHLLSLSTLYPTPLRPRFGTFVQSSLEALAKRGDWQVTVVNPLGVPPVAFGRYKPLTTIAPFEQAGGVAIHRPRFTLIPKLGAPRNPAAIVKAVLPLVREIHAHTPIDVIDAQFFYPDGPAAAAIARAIGVPHAIVARGSDIIVWGEKDFARRQMVDAACDAGHLFAVSGDLKRRMAAMGMPDDRISVHYTGLDRDRFRPLAHTQLRAQVGGRLGFALPQGVPVLACVGALIERKGQYLAIEALPSLPDARLILAGEGEHELFLRNLATELGVADRVHFAGSVDHDLLPLILSAADAMVLPTVSEGLANVWVEALACGTPVVTCDVGGASELIDRELAGQLIERSTAGVIAGVRAVLAAPRDRLAVAALVDSFSWEANAADLADHYAALAARA